jgi:hypothetical protein
MEQPKHQIGDTVWVPRDRMIECIVTSIALMPSGKSTKYAYTSKSKESGELFRGWEDVTLTKDEAVAIRLRWD